MVDFEENDFLLESDDRSWRGDIWLEDWPEELAGPEYRLYKGCIGKDDQATLKKSDTALDKYLKSL